jgi:PX domain
MEISVRSYRQITNESKSFHVYTLHIIYKDWEHIVEKRYSEFLELHKVIKLINKTLKCSIPVFPKKKYWTRFTGKTPEHLDARRSSLEIYMREISNTVCAHHCKYFIEFIGMPVRLREQWIRGEF